MAIFHANWILRVIEANFMLPIAPFVLNSDRFASFTTHCIKTTLDEFSVQSNLGCNYTLKEKASLYIPTESSYAGRYSTTPPRQILGVPESPPALSSTPAKRIIDSYLERQKSMKKSRLLPELQENENSELSIEQSGVEKPSRATTSPDISGDTLVSVPHINLLEVVQKKRNSLPRLRILRSNAGKQKLLHPILPLEPGETDNDLPRVFMSAARAALQDIQIQKSVVIRAREPHLGKSFDFSKSRTRHLRI
ncbi:hypothetical protein BC835DRAFT_490290 [Cytidiella melzeri]|nr:hypothetical protein BC835DRAFT_490290 [Cytidiella melzeri]